MRKAMGIIGVFILLGVGAVIMYFIIGFDDMPNTDALVNNIRVNYDGKESTLSERKTAEEADGIPITMDVKDTVLAYASNPELREDFDELLNGYENNDVQSKQSIKNIVLEGVKQLTWLTNEVIIDAIGLSKSDFGAWDLPDMPKYETIYLPAELTNKNYDKSISFITDNYFVSVPSKFFNESNDEVSAIVNVSYENNVFNIDFGENVNYTNWEHPVAIKIKRPNSNGDTVVTRDKTKIVRSFKKNDYLYIYTYTGGNYQIQDIEINDDLYKSFIINREILASEILQKEFITREDFIAALMRSGYTEVSSVGNNVFEADVSDTHKYIAEFKTGAGKNIVKGIAIGVLAPEQYLTIQEMYTMLGRFIDVFNVDIGGVYPNTTEIKNINDFDEYAKTWVTKMKQRGYILPNHINAYGYMSPKDPVKTDEAMELIYTLIVNGGREELKYED